MLSFPNAKINLGLNVISRRPDGYHDLETVMVGIPSYDMLEIVESGAGRDRLFCSGRRVDCPMEKNLVYKALTALRQEFEIPPVDIYLDKQTPDGAGLGGGSADAAFTLTTLDRLFGLGADRDRLARIAATVGSDCPFFIYDTPMLCTGTGTDMTPVTLNLPAGLWIMVVKPPVSVPTREAYQGITPRRPERPLTEVIALPVEQWQGLLVNDFEQSVFSRYPRLAEIKQTLTDAGAIYSAMSGSGSAIFGLFAARPDDAVAKQLGGENCYLIRRFT